MDKTELLYTSVHSFNVKNLGERELQGTAGGARLVGSIFVTLAVNHELSKECSDYSVLVDKYSVNCIDRYNG